MQETFDIVVVKLNAKHSCTPGGHGDGSVGNTRSSAAAIIYPKTGNACFIELESASGVGSGLFYRAHGVEFKLGKSIDDGISLEVLADYLFALLVSLKTAEGRLIGYVEEAFFVKTALFEFCKKRGNELSQEICVFVTDGICVPSEIFLVSSVYSNGLNVL